MTIDVLDLNPAAERDEAECATYGAPSPTADPGATASTRRLALAVLGVSDAVPLATLCDTLHDRVRTARAAGCGEAAAAFESALRYVARVVESPWPSPTGTGRSAQPSRSLLLATAVRHVRRAYTLIPGDQTPLLRRPDGPPDPTLIERPTALIDDLRDLYTWSGLTIPAITAAARRCGLSPEEDQIAATVENRRFPTAAVTEAVARGCGMPQWQCYAWLAARHRAARFFLPHPEAGRRPVDPALAAQSLLDPRDAQTIVQFSVLLSEVRMRCGLSYGQVYAAAKLAGCDASWSRLWTIGARYSFPTPRLLEAFLTGCGIDSEERALWLDARNRLASSRPRVRRTTAEKIATKIATADNPALDALRRPRISTSPDPRRARTWAEFAAMLHLLVRWSGSDLTTIARRALADGIPVTREALHYTLAHGVLPGANTLNAFTAGCGLCGTEQLQWRIARARLAALSPDSQRLPPCRRIYPAGHSVAA